MGTRHGGATRRGIAAGAPSPGGARPSRRDFLESLMRVAGGCALASLLPACGGGQRAAVALSGPVGELDPLLPADASGVRLPAGFSSRIVARSGMPVVPAGVWPWHPAPDGGAVFGADDGWIYVSNSEVDGNGGGVGALRFLADGTLVEGYPILANTSRNCAGGATPWGSWLSCEEVSAGRVWECDPRGLRDPVARPALGVFRHEAVAVDPLAGQLYLTEDQPDGRLYRFTPHRMLGPGRPDLSDGVLEVARLDGDGVWDVTWLRVPDPLATLNPTRRQLASSTPFNGGEGIHHHAGTIYFATKGDDRIWAYDVAGASLHVLYDASEFAQPILTGVDNLTVSNGAEVYVAEDGGDLQIVVLGADGRVAPVVQLVGHRRSEITGPAFSPAGDRLYFSSQRGTTGSSADGLTFEVSGPFA